jgi:biopolymer transport protein ExbD
VEEADLEAKILALFSNKEDKALILRAEEGVPIEKAVNVLDIANRNQIKVVLAVRPK